MLLITTHFIQIKIKIIHLKITFVRFKLEDGSNNLQVIISKKIKFFLFSLLFIHVENF